MFDYRDRGKIGVHRISLDLTVRYLVYSASSSSLVCSYLRMDEWGYSVVC